MYMIGLVKTSRVTARGMLPRFAESELHLRVPFGLRMMDPGAGIESFAQPTGTECARIELLKGSGQVRMAGRNRLRPACRYVPAVACQ